MRRCSRQGFRTKRRLKGHRREHERIVSRRVMISRAELGYHLRVAVPERVTNDIENITLSPAVRYRPGRHVYSTYRSQEPIRRTGCQQELVQCPNCWLEESQNRRVEDFISDIPELVSRWNGQLTSVSTKVESCHECGRNPSVSPCLRVNRRCLPVKFDSHMMLL